MSIAAVLADGARTPPLVLVASLACADPLHLGRDLAALKVAGVDALHVDIMDGDFVPNFCLSLDLLHVVREACSLPTSVHLMVNSPERYLVRCVEAGASLVIVHQEATVHLHRVLGQIRSLGVRAGVALNPATPLQMVEDVLDDLDLLLVMTVDPGFAGQRLIPSTLRKVAAARALATGRGLALDISVDGNVSFEHAADMVRAGANVLVGGSSSIFAPGLSVAEGVMRLRSAASAARADARAPLERHSAIA